jgi:acyl-coenzyme A synthetase/AMP-(fatty) acid ligase
MGRETLSSQPGKDAEIPILPADPQTHELLKRGSDIGWVVGHSYIIYAPLLAGAATVLFEGKPIGTPDSSAFWRIVQEYKVTTLSTAPSKHPLSEK